ncbi:MAG: 5-bromo-4-chloroindolyl phosphate hydrolysis family protein [Oscillibacter sp.]|nr:5-bromo-4-chloroindolyl phosphate hydrolysis family protein [Oscillibacter sp.]
MTERKPVAPFYAAAAVFVAYALFFPLYRVSHFAVAAAVSAVVFTAVSLLCRNTGRPQAEAKPAKEKEEKPTGNPELDKMLKDGRLAIAEMKRLDGNIADPEISADIVRLEQVSEKIFEQVKAEPKKLPQIRRFMDYYLPTTLKLLNAYDRASAAGISGENIDTTMKKVAGMMKTIVQAFEKQLDALFGDSALDISTDITVLENLMAREGLTGEQMHAQTSPKDDGGDIKLQV